MYYVRLKPSNFRYDSWTKRKREGNLLVVRAWEATEHNDRLTNITKLRTSIEFFELAKRCYLLDPMTLAP